MNKITIEITTTKNNITAYAIVDKKEHINEPESTYSFGKKIFFDKESENNLVANVTFSKLEFLSLIRELIRLDSAILMDIHDKR